jgi:hypothetical protein
LLVWQRASMLLRGCQMCLIAIEVYESQYGDNNEHGQEEKKSYVEVNRDSMHSARRFGTGE